MSLGSYKHHEGAIHEGACPFMNRHPFPSCTYKYCGLNHQSIQSIIYYTLSFNFTLQHVITHASLYAEHSPSSSQSQTQRHDVFTPLDIDNSPTLHTQKATSTELGVSLGNEATARESWAAFPTRIPARRRQRDQKTTLRERKSKKASRSLGMDSTDLQFFALGDGFLVFPLVACNGRRHCGRRGRHFRGGRGRRFSNDHPRHRSPGRRPAPMAPPPGHQPGPSTTAAAASSSTSDSSERTGTATPPYMTGIVDERNVVAPTPPTSGNAGFGLQAGPSTNIGGTTMALHSSFIVGTRAVGSASCMWPA